MGLTYIGLIAGCFMGVRNLFAAELNAAVADVTDQAKGRFQDEISINTIHQQEIVELQAPSLADDHPIPDGPNPFNIGFPALQIFPVK
jgi:hypothetical protein